MRAESNILLIVATVKVRYEILLRNLGSSPDAAARSVVIQRARSVPPRYVASGLRYIADYALQFYCTTCFVELVAGRSSVLVDYLHFRHCNRN